MGAFAPYGYVKAPDDKRKLVVDEYAGEIVRSVYGMYKEGMSIGSKWKQGGKTEALNSRLSSLQEV
ncbi:MAG: hypothetical protein ACI4F3_08640 [Enterocloster sp.]